MAEEELRDPDGYEQVMLVAEIEFGSGRLAEQLRWAADWIDGHRDEQVLAIQFRGLQAAVDDDDATSISVFVADSADGVVRGKVAYERAREERDERERRKLNAIRRLPPTTGGSVR